MMDEDQLVHIVSPNNPDYGYGTNYCTWCSRLVGSARSVTDWADWSHGFAVLRNSEACPDVRQPEFWLIDRRADFTIGYDGWDTQTK
jgi:hypothetical protein